MKIVQIYSDGLEELWKFPNTITADEIKAYWQEYEKSDLDSFEDFMDETYPDINCERFFVDEEIYI